MKHMWSEEEIQSLIEEEGGGNEIVLETIVDAKGRNRFLSDIVAVNDSLEGLTAIPGKCKWVLNGTILYFEITCTLAQDMPQLTLLANFALPEWILNKITSNLPQGAIDIVSYNLASPTKTISTNALIAKASYGIEISQWTPISMSDFPEGSAFFRISGNLIIDFE